MTEDEADALIDRMAAAWPLHRWIDATIAVYTRELEPLRYDAATLAVDAAIRGQSKPPSVAELLGLYRVELAHVVTTERRAGVAPDDRIPEHYLAAGREGLAKARAILNRTTPA